jgi:hypothetical protein
MIAREKKVLYFGIISRRYILALLFTTIDSSQGDLWGLLPRGAAGDFFGTTLPETLSGPSFWGMTIQ